MLTSICRSIVTICSGLYLLMGMTRFSSKWILSHSTWYKFRRSRQEDRETRLKVATADAGRIGAGRSTPVVTFFIPPLRNPEWFGIKDRQRTSEEVSQLPGESSRWLLASNSVSLQLTPFRGSHSGTRFPEGFPRKAEPPSDL